MKYRFEFELPGLPKMTNPSGKSTHWRVIKKERDYWKQAVIAHCTNYLTFLGKPVTFPLQKAKLTLVRYSSNAPDPDGLVSGFKAIVDGLVMAGIIQNDRLNNIGMPDYRWEKIKKGEGKIKVIVESED